MTTNDDSEASKSMSEKLAELVARRKDAAKSSGRGKGIPGQRESEQRAGAASASKSKPALRK